MYSEKEKRKPVNLTLHNIHDHGVNICEIWAEEVEKRTNGRVSFRIHTGENPPFDTPADVVRDVPAAGGSYHLLDLIQTPLIIPSSVVGSKVVSQLYAEFSEMREELSDSKIVGLGTGALMAFFSTEKWGPIRRLEDFKGARVRSLRPIDRAMEALGVRPVHIEFMKIAEYLERGKIDATVLGVLPANMFKLAENGAPYCTILGGKSLTMHPMRLSMSWDAWNLLPTDIQETIEEIGPTGGDCWYAIQTGLDCDSHLSGGLEYINKYGEIIIVDNEELTKWRQVIEPVVDESIREKEAMGVPAGRFYKRMLELVEEYS